MKSLKRLIEMSQMCLTFRNYQLFQVVLKTLFLHVSIFIPKFSNQNSLILKPIPSTYMVSISWMSPVCECFSAMFLMAFEFTCKMGMGHISSTLNLLKKKRFYMACFDEKYAYYEKCWFLSESMNMAKSFSFFKRYNFWPFL